MAVVSDTSPISNLALIGRLNLLHAQFGDVFVPEAVRSELRILPDPQACAACNEAFAEGWIRCLPVRDTNLVMALLHDLDPGEAEAVALAIEVRPNFVLIDEKEGRRVARHMGLPVLGLLGVLLRAKASGEVASVRSEVSALKQHARFFIDSALEHEVLRAAGEE